MVGVARTDHFYPHLLLLIDFVGAGSPEERVIRFPRLQSSTYFETATPGDPEAPVMPVVRNRSYPHFCLGPLLDSAGSMDPARIDPLHRFLHSPADFANFVDPGGLVRIAPQTHIPGTVAPEGQRRRGEAYGLGLVVAGAQVVGDDPGNGLWAPLWCLWFVRRNTDLPILALGSSYCGGIVAARAHREHGCLRECRIGVGGGGRLSMRGSRYRVGQGGCFGDLA